MAAGTWSWPAALLRPVRDSKAPLGSRGQDECDGVVERQPSWTRGEMKTVSNIRKQSNVRDW